MWQRIIAVKNSKFAEFAEYKIGENRIIWRKETLKQLVVTVDQF